MNMWHDVFSICVHDMPWNMWWLYGCACAISNWVDVSLNIGLRKIVLLCLNYFCLHW